MSKWLVVLGFEDEQAANDFVDSVAVTGGVEVARGGGWERERAVVQLGPYIADGGEVE